MRAETAPKFTEIQPWALTALDFRPLLSLHFAER
jgi:hypothetical protein